LWTIEDGGMVLNATFNNILVISWQSVLLVEETGEPGKNHRLVVSQWQTLSHNVVSSTPHHERDSNSQLQWWWALITQCSCKFNYHTITTMTAQQLYHVWFCQIHYGCENMSQILVAIGFYYIGQCFFNYYLVTEKAASKREREHEGQIRLKLSFKSSFIEQTLKTE